MKYLSSVLISFLAFCFLWVVLIYIQMGSLTKGSKWIHEAYKLKESAALKISHKKVVIVSGSNALFGFNSENLEKQWNMPVINDGVHAGLGMPYILHRSKKTIRNGDIILLPLEYTFYQTDGIPSETYTDFIFSRDAGYFYDLSLIEKLIIISKVSIKRIYKGLKSNSNKQLKPTKGVYGIQNINRYGDQINIEPEKMTEREKAAIDNSAAKDIIDSKLSISFISAMNDYLIWAKNKGICIIVMPPNYMFFDRYRSKDYEELFSNIKEYFTKKNVAFIGSPLNYMYEKKYYFNTVDHMNSLGVLKRTDQVINDIGETPRIYCNDIGNKNSLYH